MRVHPRVCGSSALVPESDDPFWRSSPRVRAQPVAMLDVPDIYTFIPACAGAAKCPMTALDDFSVHPRVCGSTVYGERG